MSRESITVTGDELAELAAAIAGLVAAIELSKDQINTLYNLVQGILENRFPNSDISNAVQAFRTSTLEMREAFLQTGTSLHKLGDT